MRTKLLFAFIIGLLIGICCTMALHVDRPGPDAGDWLTFAGALLGVVFTIVGTLLLESYRASVRADEEKRIILDSLNDVKVALTRAKQPRGDVEIGAAREERLQNERLLLESFERFDLARHLVPTRNIEFWHTVESLKLSFDRERPNVRQEIAELTDAGDNEQVFAVNIAKMEQLFARISDSIEKAIRLATNYKP